ncbi:MAG TPA: extracellular solute-binding protein [Chloroflexota bacterium]|nr:extracellular solute-binding protein [Chloroflexota bacterium]
MRQNGGSFGRRDVLRLGLAAGAIGVLAACGAPAAPTPEPAKPAAPPPTTAPAPTKPAAATKPAEAPKPAPAATKPAEATKPAAGATPAAAKPATGAAAVTNLKLLGWTYEPPLVRENLDRFEQQNPGFKVDYEPVAGDYLEKLLTNFRAKTPMDVIYVRDQYHASWVESGFLQPLVESDELSALYADMFPYNAEQMQWKGKKYGLPYYTDFDVFAYNEKMLNDAGFDKPPATLDDVRKYAETMKKKGIADSPIYMDLAKGSDAMWDYWMYTFASGGHLLEKDGEPTYPDKDKVPQAILEWWVAAANDWQIVNAKANMEPLPQGALTPIRAQGTQPGYGTVAFEAHSRYDLEGDNAPERSKSAIPGKINIKFGLFPGLDASSPHNVPAWNRYYGIPATAKDKTASMELIKYLGGKDKSGQYYTAKRWWLLRGLGMAYKSPWSDPEVQEKTKKFIADPALMQQQNSLGVARDGLEFPWWTDWYMDLQANVQQALLKQKSPKEALTASANKARALKKEWEKK